MAEADFNDFKRAISSIEEIIEDARNGRMFILVDHEDRENEGDLVIPAADGHPRGRQLHGDPWPRADLPGDAGARGSTRWACR